MAQMSVKFKEMGSEVYIEAGKAEAVKASNKDLG